MKTLLNITILLSTTAYGATLYTQTGLNDNAFDITSQRLADDFVVAQDSVLTGIDFWYQAQQQSDLSTVTWAVYLNSGGAPGTLAASGSAMPTTSAVPGAFSASLQNLSLFLTAGTYWLELHAGSSVTDDNAGLAVYWAAVADNRTPSAQMGGPGLPDTPITVSGFQQYGFVLFGDAVTSVPEPSTGASIGWVLLAALAVHARRKTP